MVHICIYGRMEPSTFYCPRLNLSNFVKFIVCKSQKLQKFPESAPSQSNWKKLRYVRTKIKNLYMFPLSTKFQNTPWFWKFLVRCIFGTFWCGPYKNEYFLTIFFPERENLTSLQCLQSEAMAYKMSKFVKKWGNGK